MKETDPLDALLREWKSSEPAPELDERVRSAYRSAVQVRPQGGWRRFWSLRISIPAPVLLAAAAVLVAVFFWLRSSAVPAISPLPPGIVTHLNASGFRPLPDGQARIIEAKEIHQ